MVCSTAILSSTLALSLLRYSSLPSQSFVLSPFSLNSALSIIHDGANGRTQEELTNLLLNGCAPSDVTAHYSSLTQCLSSTNGTGVELKIANRFYVDRRISLESDYQMHVEDTYGVQVANVNMRNTIDTSKSINEFVEGATNGKIRDVIKPDGISDDMRAILVNAMYFNGKWKEPFERSSFGKFEGLSGERKIEFMKTFKFNSTVRANLKNDIGTLLILPYENEEYNFFYLMPKEISNLENMRNELTGDKLLSIIKGATDKNIHIIVPKFNIESELDGKKVLSKMGVESLFNDGADLSKISDTPLKVSKITHNAVIEVDESGTVAAAASFYYVTDFCNSRPPPTVVIDRPFLFGILRNDDILFLGQFA